MANNKSIMFFISMNFEKKARKPYGFLVIVITPRTLVRRCILQFVDVGYAGPCQSLPKPSRPLPDDNHESRNCACLLSGLISHKSVFYHVLHFREQRVVGRFRLSNQPLCQAIPLGLHTCHPL